MIAKVNNEGSEELTARLKAEKRWKLYLVRRAQLEAAGISKRNSWGIAAKEFPPEGIEPVYYTDVPDEGLFSGNIVDISVPMSTFGRSVIRDSEYKVEIKTLDDDKPKVISPANGEKARNGLIPPEILEFYRENQKFTPRKDVEWVHLNLALPEPKWETAPSSGALSMYQWAKVEKSTFYQLFKSFLPTQAQTNAAQRLEDDGRDTLDLIDRVILAEHE